MRELTDEQKKKIWDKLKFYYKNQTNIKITYSQITVSGKIEKMNRFFCNSYIILDSNETKHKILIEDIIPGTIFPSETKVEEHFVKRSYERKSIPKSVRDELWRNHFGEQWEGNCFVCKKYIRKDNFEAAHVISVDNGGEDTLSNLRPTCRTCNRSMGTMNLEDFKKEYH